MCQRILIRQYASSPREDKSGYERQKTTRDCRGHEQRSPSGQLIIRSFPGRNECPGTHCSLIEQEKRRQFPEFDLRGKMKEKTERVSDRRRREEKWQACWCCRDQQNGAGFSEKLEHTQPAEKNKWPQCHRESSWQVRWSRLYQKKGTKHQIVRGRESR